MKQAVSNDIGIQREPIFAAIAALIFAAVSLAAPAVATATVGGPTLIVDIVEDTETGDVYWKQERRDATGQSRLHHRDTGSGETTTAIKTGDELGLDVETIEQRREQIEEVIGRYDALSRVDLEETDLELDVQLRDDEDAYDPDPFGPPDLMRIPYTARITEGGELVEAVEFTGCRPDQKIVVDGFFASASDLLVLRFSAESICMESGYVAEKIVVVRDVEIEKIDELEDRDLEALREQAGLGPLPLPRKMEGSVAETTGFEKQEIEAHFEALDDESSSRQRPDPPQETDAVVDELCDDREPCNVMNRWDAGEVDGTSMMVFELALHDRGDEGRTPDLHDCAPFEYWLVESRDGEWIDYNRLQEVCNDGYGARGMGEDSIDVDDNTFAHSQHGGSNWMWSITAVLELSPLQVVEHHRSGSFVLDVNRRSESWDWTRPAGGVTWTAPRCDEREDKEGYGTKPEHGEYRFDFLMQIEVDDAFRDGGWKTTGLNDCSLQVDSRGNDAGDDSEDFGSGYVIHGDPADPSEASFRAVMDEEATLYLEIRDAEWITGADRWIHDDHVEIWTGSATGYMNHCLETDEPSQWGIALFDDEVYPGYNDPDPEAISVQRHLVGDDEDPDAVRMKIEFSSTPEAVTVVYSDTEDGNGQDRLIATSDLRHGDAASLGKTREISSGEARCTIVDGELEFEDLRTFESATILP